MRVDVPVRLLESALVEVPTLIGWLRPTILVPASVFIGLTPDQLEAILAHELAHVRRYDYLVNLFQTVIETILFYHPAVWWISRKLREERENCCDDIALEVMQNRLVYVSALARLEEGRSMPLVLTASGGSLLQRIKRIVGANNRKVSAWPLWALMIGVLAVVCLTKLKAIESPVVANASMTPMGHAEAMQKGVAALVNHRPIFWTDIANDLVLSERYREAKDGDKHLLQFVVQEAIDRELVIQDAEASGYRVPQSDLDERINYGVKGFGGNKDAFVENLKKNDLSLEQFTEQNRRSETCERMFILRVDTPTKAYLHDHPPSLSGASPEEIKKAEETLYQTESTRLENDWMQSLRAKAVIQTFKETTADEKSDASIQLPDPHAQLTTAVRKSDEASGVTEQQIVDAVKKNDAVSLAKLVDGINVGKIQDGDKPLLFLTQNHEIAKILLEHGADPNARCGDNGAVPLFLARDSAMVDLLIAHGADPKLKSNNGHDALDYVGWQDPSVFDALIRGGVPFDVRTNGPDKLQNASSHGNVPLMTKLLDLGVDPNQPGVYFRDGTKVKLVTPLANAVNSGSVPATALLLDHGAKTEGDKAKIMVIAVEAYPAIAKLLWSRGNRDVSPLVYAISQGASVQEIAKLLDEGSPTDPPQDKDLTPLGAVVKKGNLDAVKLLVERGADVNKCSYRSATESNSPLALAACEGQDEVVGYLLVHGAKPDPVALYEAAHNSTPYQTGRSHEHFEKTVRLLLDAGALKNATSEEQGYIVYGPIWTRQGPPNATVLKMILDAGGNPNAPMPFTTENGEKPNTVIGYYRNYCAQHKEDPNFGTGWEKIKPMLDMLEAADRTATLRDEGKTPS